MPSQAKGVVVTAVDPHGVGAASGLERDGAEPAGLLAAAREAITQADPNLPILKLEVLDAFFRGSLPLWVLATAGRLFPVFGAIAFLLAVGVYAVRSYVVSHRTHEIAVLVTSSLVAHQRYDPYVKLILLGATGMVGAGALREALADPGVEAVLSVSRRPCGVTHAKLRELLLPDLFDFAAVESQLTGWDACVWAVGISSVGLDEAAYARVTEELTLVWARALVRLNPVFSFCYCSALGAGGNTMWARVRRRVEDGIQALPFRHAGCVRPGFIQPGPGIRSTVRVYQTLIVVFRPLFPLLVKALPAYATTSERLGRAMLRVVQGRADRFILESADINRIGA